MDLSIVSGTFNRLKFLQSMVKSVRNSLSDLHGFNYEIVLVDGGSTDGTIAWCQKQEDIKLIHHGELKGAVKAFNDGAYASTGKYVILGNDDIEFVGRSVLVAYIYMENNPDCGAGCFYQNRNGRDWHVEVMPAVTKQKQQVTVPYAQVGIFPKWLGDSVGWWCRDEDFMENLTAEDYKLINDGRYGLHTYGGDNELSAKIIDLGFPVSPIPDAKIMDKEADDNLRKMNNIENGKDPKSVRGHHPDSWKWGKRWFRRNQKIGYRDLAGPIIKDKVMIENPFPSVIKERALYLPLFEQGWTVQKEQKRGLRDALSKVAITLEYDYMRQFNHIGKARMMEELRRLCISFQPTVFLSQLHNPDQINPVDIKGLRQSCPDGTKFANWNGDYWPDQLLDEKGLSLARSFDLMTTVNRDVVEKHRNEGINTQYWQIGWETDGTGHEPEIYHDVVFLASGYSEKRQQLGKLLDEQDFSFGLYGHGWPGDMSKGECLYNFIEACKIYRGAKLAIGDSQWPDSGFVSNRIFQILAAGNCVLCHQWFDGYEKLGLIDKENCIIWKDLSDLKLKLNYWIGRDRELKEMAKKGELLAFSTHSFEARTDELWRMLGLGILAESEASWR